MKTTAMMIAVLVMSLLYADPASAGCRYFSANEMRGIVSNKLIMSGMSQRQLEHSWGKPTKKVSDSSGERWEYWHPQGDTIVEFDTSGCVKAWRTERP